jgi:TonB family protein
MKKIICLLLVFVFASEVLSQNGVINSYYSKRKLRESISYVNNILDGTSYWFYQNGNVKEEKTYSAGKLNGWLRYYYESGLVKEEISVRDGIRDGLMRIFYDNGALKEVRTYEGGRLIKRVQLDYDSLYVASLDEYKGNKQTELRRNRDLFLCELETCPRPAGGMEAIQNNLVYPEYAKMYGLEGKVTIIADVDVQGNVTDTRIVEGLGLGCDEAASEAVLKTKFLPGANGNTAVASTVIFKVEFKLSDEDKNNALLPDQQLVENNAELRKYLNLESTQDNITETASDVAPENITEQNQAVLRESISNFKCDIDICPNPVGGLNGILQNLVIPQRIKRLKISGDVTVEADVDQYGLVRDTKVISGIGYGADVAVEVAILSTQFNPGMDDNNPVRTNVIVVVPIVLEEEEND